MLAQVSNYVKSVDNTFIFITGICIFLLLLISFLMVFFVIKYNRKRNPRAQNIHGNLPLEITWTVIPIILVLFMFWFGWTDYKQYTDVPKNSMVIDVTGKMWQWSFKYPNGLALDTLYVPRGENIRLNLGSLDVNHSFYIPAFRIKKDALPGRKNYVWFKADSLGAYDIFCSEYCGLNHSYMYSKLKILPKEEWLVFMDKQKRKSGEGMNQKDSTKTN